jgi:predicted DNA-binding protein
MFGEKDVEGILQRLDRLSNNEARTTAAEIFKVIYGLIRDMSAYEISSTCLPVAECPSF